MHFAGLSQKNSYMRKAPKILAPNTRRKKKLGSIRDSNAGPLAIIELRYPKRDWIIVLENELVWDVPQRVTYIIPLDQSTRMLDFAKSFRFFCL
jgi:hypothetical protein